MRITEVAKLLLVASVLAAVPAALAQSPSRLSAAAVSNISIPQSAWKDRLFQYQLGSVLNLNTDLIEGVSIYFIDLFDTPPATVAALKAKGLLPACYFSAGSYEDWRPDKARFQKKDYSAPLEGWAGESWLDVRSSNVRAIMADRIKLCKDRGYVAIDPDNVDVHIQESGFPITADDMRSYLEFLSRTAASYGLATGLKNSMSLLNSTFVDFFAFAVNEQCFSYEAEPGLPECRDYELFKEAGKPVYQIQYSDGDDPTTVTAFNRDVCGDNQARFGVTSILKVLKLLAKPWRACPGAVEAALAASANSTLNLTAVLASPSGPNTTVMAGAPEGNGTSVNGTQNAGSTCAPSWWVLRGLLLVVLSQLLVSMLG